MDDVMLVDSKFAGRCGRPYWHAASLPLTHCVCVPVDAIYGNLVVAILHAFLFLTRQAMLRVILTESDCLEQLQSLRATSGPTNSETRLRQPTSDY
eukprot:2385394-Amphidinium_carterae.2